MKFSFSATKPEDVEFTLKATMTLLQWNALATTLSSVSSPANELQRAIIQLLREAKSSKLYPIDDKPPDVIA